MALRIKAGGPTQVISAADAKKLGIKVAEKVVKDTGIKPADKKAVKEEKKVGGKENIEADNSKKTPATVNGVKPPGVTTTTTKVKTAVNTISASNAITGKKGAKDANDEDPIEESLNLRIKAGGVTQVVAADKKAGTKPAPAVSKTSAKEAPVKEAPKKPEEKKVEEKKSSASVKTPAADSNGVASKKSSTNIPGALSNVPKVMKGKKKNEEEKKQETEVEAEAEVESTATETVAAVKNPKGLTINTEEEVEQQNNDDVPLQQESEEA